MDRQKLALSVAIVILGFACFVLGCIAVAIPYWGNFRSRVREERGHFGPWTMCKDIGYGRDLCGSSISSFRLMTVVRAAGICSAIGTATLGLYCIASIFQISMQVTRSRILFHYHNVVFVKLVCAVCTAITTIAAVGLFAAQSDDLERGYIVEASFCFYMEVILAIFTFILMLLTIVEYTTLRKLRLNLLLSGAQEITSNGRSGGGGGRSGFGAKARPQAAAAGQTTNLLLPQMGFGTTIGNPGFREPGGGINTNGIAMTDSSARFVPSSVSSQPVLIKNSKISVSHVVVRSHRPPSHLQIGQGQTIISNLGAVGVMPGSSSQGSLPKSPASTRSVLKSPGMSRLALARQLSIEKKERKKARKIIRSVVGNTVGGGGGSRRPPSPSPSASSASSIKKAYKVVKTKKSFFNFRSSSSAPSTSRRPPPSSPSPSTSDWNNDSVSIVPTPDSINGDSAVSVISSVSTISTLASTITPSSALARGPLRSSLKKSKPASTPDDSFDSVFGIQNPGFSTTSPTLSRTGSLKKVRIQTISTDV